MRTINIKQLAESYPPYMIPDAILDQVIVDLIRKYAKGIRKQQIAQEKEFRDKLKPNTSLTYIVRDQDKPDEQPLENILRQKTEKPRIIILKNDIIHMQDVVHFSPNFRKYAVSLFATLEEAGKFIEESESELDGMLAFRKKIAHVMNDYIGKSTIAGFMANTANKIQDEIFNGQDCDVIIVRNSISEDLIKSVEMGGGKTVVVVSGHGSISSVSMNDKVVSNDTLPTPKEPLRAFVQHTCAGKGTGTEIMGERIAEEVYGSDINTTDAEFVRNPLTKRDMTKYKFTKSKLPFGKIYLETEK